MSDPGRPRPFVLAAGGTGGHLFPAESLARELKARGHRVELISDDRVEPFRATFPADAIHRIDAGTVTGRGLLGKAKGVAGLLTGLAQSMTLLLRLRPRAVVGFGGYPSVPPVLAATLLGRPTVLHEQNAVMGRANRFLAGRVRRVATGFALGGATVQVGNPVRAAVIEAAALVPPPAEAGQPLRLLVFGGSQGARIMAEIVPPAMALLTAEERGHVRLTQQVRTEDLESVRATYAELGVEAGLAPFFRDLPTRMAASHLVVSRSGASTIAELQVIGRAAVLVPLPGSLDQDQANNARVLAEAGAATLVLQKDFTPERLAAELRAALADLPALAGRGARARALAIPDAARRLADLVEGVAGA
jgi:UDP-N-acetylglucosamine--N-acetylmuramyl-(pentapeptide) pyrophosphoryl-undecaprenol N-acetylglucosamine transferase